MGCQIADSSHRKGRQAQYDHQRQRNRVHLTSYLHLGKRSTERVALHHAGKANVEWLLRELQWRVSAAPEYKQHYMGEIYILAEMISGWKTYPEIGYDICVGGKFDNQYCVYTPLSPIREQSMTEFGRQAHFRTNANGTTFWVRGHVVRRDVWNQSLTDADLRKSEAISILHRSLARTLSGCYIIPNARCPLCREPVFFYVNSFGSRVFFDELGPSWSKHPCTDNPKKPGEVSGEFRQPAVRIPAERLELLKNALLAGYQEKSFYGEGRDRFHLLVVNSVVREGRRYLVICECITADPAVTVHFKFTSKDPIFDVGDFVSKRGVYFSFYCLDHMRVVTFRSGDDISLSDGVVSISQPLRVEALSVAQTQSIPIIWREALDGLPEGDRLHFETAKVSVGELCGRAWSVARRMPGNRDPKAEHLASHLNKNRCRTACGLPWTPSLAAVFLSLLLNNNFSIVRKRKKTRLKPNAPRLSTAGLGLSAMSDPQRAKSVDPFEDLVQAIASED